MNAPTIFNYTLINGLLKTNVYDQLLLIEPRSGLPLYLSSLKGMPLNLQNLEEVLLDLHDIGSIWITPSIRILRSLYLKSLEGELEPYIP